MLPREYAPTLITLDPVSNRGWYGPYGIPFVAGFSIRDDELAKPTRGTWINVYRPTGDTHVWLGGSIQISGKGSCESIASHGGVWGRQRWATQSFPFAGGHCEVRDMFNDRAKEHIRRTTACVSEK